MPEQPNVINNENNKIHQNVFNSFCSDLITLNLFGFLGKCKLKGGVNIIKYIEMFSTVFILTCSHQILFSWKMMRMPNPLVPMILLYLIFRWLCSLLFCESTFASQAYCKSSPRQVHGGRR